MTSNSSSSGARQPQPSGAMALLDKYATINNAIDEARRRSSVAQLKVENIQQRTQQLQDEKNDTELQTKKAVAEKADLIIQQKQAIAKTRDLKQAISDAKMKRNAAEHDLEMASRYIEETRRSFLKRCREFRFACKKLRISAPSSENNIVGGMHSSIRFSTRFPESPSSSEYEYEDSSEDEDSLIFSATKTIENQSISGNTALSSIDDEWESTSISNHPKAYGGLDSKRHPKHLRDETHKTKKQLLSKANDEEMQNAEEKAKSCYQARVEAKRGLDDAKVDHESATARSNDRQKKLEQQRSQLNRVKSIVEDMEKDFANSVRETREAKQKKEDERRDTYRRERAAINSNAGSSYSRHFDVPEDMLTPPARLSAPKASQHQGWERASHITPSPPDSNNQNGTFNAHSWNAPNQRPTGSNTNAPLLRQHSSQAPLTRPVNPYRVARPNNPYNKSNHGVVSAYGSTHYGFETSSRERESERNANHLTIQHPHRAGLIRENRQFGTALEITSGRENRSESSNQRSKHQFQAPRSQHAHNDGPPQTGVFDTRNKTNMTTLQNKANPQLTNYSFGDSDEEDPPAYSFGDSDDEDDSELLEFVAFQA